MYFNGLVFLSAVKLATALYVNGNVTAPCDSPIYCHGDLLREVELAQPFSDSKTFVDMPALKPLADIQDAFNKLQKPLSNNTDLHKFLADNFGPAGGELTAVPASSLTTNATFLSKVTDPVLRDFTAAVINIWPDLTRQYVKKNGSENLPTSFLPVDRPFVIAGGRFREPYYWDTLWIIEGLLHSGGSFVNLARNAIENFLDFIERYGFVPNGARVYYLNRSQPPVLALVTKTYIERTNDTSILYRALPLLESEYDFWMQNRSVIVKANSGANITLNVYRVNNTQPRPESYREDYLTATEGNVTDKAKLYSNLASGAESGWDYSAGRWLMDPADATQNRTAPLKSLNTNNIVPVDLNSILYGVERAMASFHRLLHNNTGAEDWDKRAAVRAAAIHSLLWNEEHYAYFDYNLTALSQDIYVPLDSSDTSNSSASAFFRSKAPQGYKRIHSVSSYFPFWMGAAPPRILDHSPAILKAFAPIEALLASYPGGIAATNVASGQQWDFPNVWPPHMYVLMSALSDIPVSPHGSSTAYASSRTALSDLAKRVAQRYIDSAFCTWYATGGSSNSTVRYSGAEKGSNGVMFEKYSAERVDVAGSGGEYEVVEGFGWTNGILIWAVEKWGADIKVGNCEIAEGQRNVRLSTWDMKWIKQLGRDSDVYEKEIEDMDDEGDE